MSGRKKPKGNLELFVQPDGQLRMLDRSAEQQVMESQQVECLGLTFDNDAARRAYFTEKLREQLKDPAFRAIEGFPIADDEAILRLSDPPYYTACPNPWLADFVKEVGKPYDPANDDYQREPFAVDVSEGKTDPIYNAHSYHTKVPHKAIMRAILHYTEPGDLVLDGFAGSGMTGVAAQLCGSPDPEFRQQLELERKAAGQPAPKWGARHVVLNDLSPAATFIEANYNLPFDVAAFEREARRILRELDAELGWMYETRHTDGTTRGKVNFTVWSQVFACPNCGWEVVFLREALDPKTKRVRDVFACPSCRAELSKDNLQKLSETRLDPAAGEPWQRIRLAPVLIEYVVGGRRFEKTPDPEDLRILEQIASLPLPASMPTNEFPIAQMYHGSRLAPKGFTRIHHLYLPRSSQALGALWLKAAAVVYTGVRHALFFLLDSQLVNLSVQNRYRPAGTFPNSPLGGVYYVSSLISEASVPNLYESKVERFRRAFQNYHPLVDKVSVSTGSCARLLNLSQDSVDYIFTDPPFGENIFYADLNFLVESWHRVWTNATAEAIIDPAKHKGLPEYQHLIQRCFEEYQRVLKPGRWMTVVFHNSRNSVWNAIQEALLAAGFVVADVRTLDKQQGSYRQVTSTTLKQDMIISAYKPSAEFERRFELKKGTPEGVWDFVRAHLRLLPVVVTRADGRVEIVAERLGYFLFDRMVAFHVQRGVSVPLSTAEFYAGLKRFFPERDGMYFLPDQVVEYDAKKLAAGEVAQLPLIVTDEQSAIRWLRQQLQEHPQTYQELFPKFLKEIGGWSKHEKPLEMRELLEEGSFIYDGKGPIPDQIWAWMTTRPEWSGWLKGKDPRNPDAALRAEARDRWYAPDPNNLRDLEQLRERRLLAEFEEYRLFKGRKLKVFRLEAVRAGFRKAWADQDYHLILSVADKIPEDVLQEDPKLLMWYDQAVTRTGGVQ